MFSRSDLTIGFGAPAVVVLPPVIAIVGVPAGALPPQPGSRNGGGNGNLTYSHDTVQGADAIAAAGAAEFAAIGGAAPQEQPRQRVVSDREQIGRNDPCWCGSGKKYKRCHGA